MCIEKEKDIGKTGWNKLTHSDCMTGVSACKFPRHVYDCGINNNCLQEPFLV